MVMNGDLLQPGVQIKPHVSDMDVRNIVRKEYGLEITHIKDLVSYDDQNFYIKVDKSDGWPHGYVFKVMNSLDSKKTLFIDAQNELLIFLGKHGIKCPQPVKNIEEKYYSLQKNLKQGCNPAETEHVVRVLTFLPGVTLPNAPHSKNLFYKCGRYVANLDNIMKNFKHPGYERHQNVWALTNVPLLKNFLYVINEDRKKNIVEEVIKSFEESVLPRHKDFEKGLIHGDFNEHNILCGFNVEDDEWDVTGIIDFGDSHISCYLFEISITLCYMMLQNKNNDSLDIGGHVLAGYVSKRKILTEEFLLIKTCVCARLCQSLVLGTYSHHQDPENDYVLDSMQEKWTLLFLLWSTPTQELYKKWNNIIQSYENQT